MHQLSWYRVEQMSDTKDIKEIIFPSNAMEGATTYKERRRRRRTRKAPEDSLAHGQQQPQPIAPVKTESVVVEKTSKHPPIVILSPPKKKMARLLLVPSKTEKKDTKKVVDRRKTFRAKRVVLTIDNTAKTAKRRSGLMKQVDALSDEQLRETAIAAKLARRESVAKVPEKLLRQMVKDYQSIRGAYV